MITKKRVDQLLERLNKLNVNGIKVYLDMVTDLDNRGLYFKISAVDRKGETIEEETFIDIPRVYLEKYGSKYKTMANIRTYNKINGELVDRKM